MSHDLHKIIDPHLHLFNLQHGDYGWLKQQNPPYWPDKHLINKNFVEGDLVLSPRQQLAGFVHVEAGFDNQQPWREIDWLQQHCTLPFKSVAFADITAMTFREHIKQLKQRKSVVGIRHILDEQATEILSATLIQPHFSLLADMAFSFDAQLSLADTRAVELLIALANNHQTVPIIINHAGWPPANKDNNGQKNWLVSLQKLAECENIAIKLSGWEMLNRAWQVKQLEYVLHHCLTTLGDKRVMLASNFPLCEFSMSYSELWNTYMTLPEITPNTLKKITCNNAKEWYHLP
ncbi:amidohydrolase family protein [uncultured Paraglaciecola sp.]|uniref:amidohydrolase family protein n=1 Tax=uncultured Paraglaciecola sp. TaxID=1765024 RepID=UPI0030D82932|tara:strand:- start:89728 stop:90600 length:873 start_codon:yes stop_codon:yes gene_type:complete